MNYETTYTFPSLAQRTLGASTLYCQIIGLHFIARRFPAADATLFSQRPAVVAGISRPAFPLKFNSRYLRDSAVGIACGYWLLVGSRVFNSRRPDRLWGSPQHPIQWVPATLSPGVKRPGCEADHSPPSSPEVKKLWFYTCTPPYAFMV
jgi:hypothetical protein